jgi:hypothetical protein
MTYVYMEPLLTHYDQLPVIEPRRPESLVSLTKDIFDLVAYKMN